MKCSRCGRHATTGLEVTAPDKSTFTFCTSCCRETLAVLVERAPRAVVQRWRDEVLASSPCNGPVL